MSLNVPGNVLVPFLGWVNLVARSGVETVDNCMFLFTNVNVFVFITVNVFVFICVFIFIKVIVFIFIIVCFYL